MNAVKVDLSVAQRAAMDVLAKKFRMSPADTLKVLAFQVVNTWNDEMPMFREHLEDVAQVVLQGGVLLEGMDHLCGLEELGGVPPEA